MERPTGYEWRAAPLFLGVKFGVARYALGYTFVLQTVCTQCHLALAACRRPAPSPWLGSAPLAGAVGGGAGGRSRREGVGLRPTTSVGGRSRR